MILPASLRPSLTLTSQHRAARNFVCQVQVETICTLNYSTCASIPTSSILNKSIFFYPPTFTCSPSPTCRHHSTSSTFSAQPFHQCCGIVAIVQLPFFTVQLNTSSLVSFNFNSYYFYFSLLKLMIQKPRRKGKNLQAPKKQRTTIPHTR